MKHALIRITPKIISELIDLGYIVAADTDSPRLIEIPADAQVSRMWCEGEIAPIGEFVIELEHEHGLWETAPGAEIPKIAIKVFR